jgi:hypothetical protein
MCPACGTCCGDPWHGDDRLRAQVAACEALAEEWERDTGDYRNLVLLADLRAALDDHDAVLAQVRAEAWDEGGRAWRSYMYTQDVRPQNPYRGGDDGRA